MANDYDDDGVVTGRSSAHGLELPCKDCGLLVLTSEIEQHNCTGLKPTTTPMDDNIIIGSPNDVVMSYDPVTFRVHKPFITEAILGGEPECSMKLSAPMPKLWRRVLWRILGVRFEVIDDAD